MTIKDVLIYILSFLCLFLCWIWIQQGNSKNSFVLPKTGKYCYAKTQTPKNIVSLAEFSSLDDCEDFLKESLFLNRK